MSNIQTIEQNTSRIEAIQELLQSKSLVPSPTGTLEITENGTFNVTEYASAEVNVADVPATLQEKSITPTKEMQEVVADNGFDGLSKVNVGAIPSEYIKPTDTLKITENGTFNVTEYAGAEVNVPSREIELQEKSITPTKETQEVVADNGFDGLSKVNVSAIPSEYIKPTGTLEITENGTHSVTEYESVSVNVAGSGGGNQELIDLLSGATTEVTIPGEIETVNPSILSGATKLSKVTMLDGVKNINAQSFTSCSGLTAVTIPKTVETIGKNAFLGTSAMTQLNYNAVNVQDVTNGDQVFRAMGSSSTGVELNIGEDVERLPEFLFCPGTSGVAVKINTINFPINSKCTSLGTGCFYNCLNGTFNINWNGANNTITEFGDVLFSGAKGMTNITIPLGVTQIPKDCFKNCTGLTSVEMHDNITQIGSSAFYGCTALTKLVMPSKLTTIDTSAFYKCSNIITYDFTKCEAIPTLGTSAFGSTSSSRKIYVPDALYDQWIVATNWVDQASYIVKASEMPTE